MTDGHVGVRLQPPELFMAPFLHRRSIQVDGPRLRLECARFVNVREKGAVKDCRHSVGQTYRVAPEAPPQRGACCGQGSVKSSYSAAGLDLRSPLRVVSFFACDDS